MKTIFTALGLATLLSLGACDSDPAGDDYEPAAQAPADDVPEGGPEESGDESLYEGAVPEWEEAESGEVGDGDQ